MFNTPSSHRVHHARNPEYLDANYGGVLIVFDRLFGTYIAERADVRCDYGLISHAKSSHNHPGGQLRAVDRPFQGPARRRARCATSGCILFGPPGWRPDGEGLTTAEIRRRAGRFPRLRPGGPSHSGMT